MYSLFKDSVTYWSLNVIDIYKYLYNIRNYIILIINTDLITKDSEVDQTKSATPLGL